MTNSLHELADLFQAVSINSLKIVQRQQERKLRIATLQFLNNQQPFTKLAFDTRRIDQGHQIIPRRNLQNYHRSDPFVSTSLAQKLASLSKLREAVKSLENKYGNLHQWQDSNARVLLNTLDIGLRTNQQDQDYTETQQSVGSIDYIDQLLNVRYRLSFPQLQTFTHEELVQIVLNKDEELSYPHLHNLQSTAEITKRDIATQPYDSLMEKLFGNVKASADGKSVQREVRIIITDSILEDTQSQ